MMNLIYFYLDHIESVTADLLETQRNFKSIVRNQHFQQIREDVHNTGNLRK